jgi:hypothetical protein
MKKESEFKKFLVCTGYFLIALFLVFSLFYLIVETSSKENSRIVQAADNNSYFRNENPSFTVDFINNEYIRFESEKSYINPFEETKASIIDRIKYLLGLNRERLGLTIKLEGIYYDDGMREILEEKGFDIDDNDIKIKKDFELVESGREIGGTGSEPVSRDTIVSRNIYKGIDVEYQIIPGKGLKEEIILRELPEYSVDCESNECMVPANKYIFKLTLDKGLEFRRNITGIKDYPSGTLYIVDKEGNYYAHFLPEFAIDSVGNKTSKVSVNILEGENSLEYYFELILDAHWLMSSERVFPIRIDPSIVHDSSLEFDLASLDRTEIDSLSLLRLRNSINGVYTSNILSLGDNVILENIKWDSYGVATGNGELPFSNIGLILEENFNSTNTYLAKWGGGSLELNGSNSTFKYNFTSSESNYYSVDLWLYNRYRANVSQESIFSSSLGSLFIKNGLYTFVDFKGDEYVSKSKVEYNKWKHITIVFSTTGQQLSFFIDGVEEKIPFDYNVSNNFSTIVLGSSSGIDSMFGYIDTLRVYERLLTRYEVLSNTQYTNMFLQYRNSPDSKIWSKWYNNFEYIPEYIEEEKYIELLSNQEKLGSYDLLSFSYLSDKDRSIYIGKSKLGTRIDDSNTYLLEREVSVNIEEPITFVDFIFTPNTFENSCLLSLGTISIKTNENGYITYVTTNGSATSLDSYLLNQPNYLALYFDKEGGLFLLNGNLSTSELLGESLAVDSYQVGHGCAGEVSEFKGEFTDLRVSTRDNITANEILETYRNVGGKYRLKQVFKAKLLNTINNLKDTVITISELEYGEQNYIVNLNIGDQLVITSNEHTIEGEVISINRSTGLVEVEAWKGTISTAGFTTDSNVYKWQTEYIPLKNYIEVSGPVNNIYVKKEDDVKIENIILFTAIKEEDSEIFSKSNNNQYIQYRYILTSSKLSLSPFLSSVNIEYTVAGPTMEQIMRHGKWFSEGEQQPFWWVK